MEESNKIPLFVSHTFSIICGIPTWSATSKKSVQLVGRQISNKVQGDGMQSSAVSNA